MVSVPDRGLYRNKLLAVIEEQHEQTGKPSEGIESLKPAAQPMISLDQIRNHLSQTLPDYMIPNSLLVLEQLPLTESKKLDRVMLTKYVGNSERPREQYESYSGSISCKKEQYAAVSNERADRPSISTPIRKIYGIPGIPSSPCMNMTMGPTTKACTRVCRKHRPKAV